MIGSRDNSGRQSSRARHRNRRPSKRTALTLGVVSVVAAAVSLVAASNASANLTGSTFEGNDGNLVVDTTGNTDWATVAGLNTGVDLPSGRNDNSFGQGTHEDDPSAS